MKLLRIGVENLNSLYGRHDVDLEQTFQGEPLFLITGPTGAGKSTVMDAVSLALFGQTPRLADGRNREDENPGLIVSRGTGEGVAELEFSRVVAGRVERYRASWRCRRARGKADGELQAPERTLAHLRDDGTWETLVGGTKKRDHELHFGRVLDGMTVKDFKRAVLLAQGEFAAFLRASEDERAGILERLTETSKYREIGALAAGRKQAAKAAWELAQAELAGVQNLPESEELALRAQVVALTAGVTQLRAQVTQTRAAHQWRIRSDALAAELGRAQGQLGDAVRALNEAQAGLDQLAAHERCEAAAQTLRRTDDAAQRWQAAQAKVPTLAAVVVHTEQAWRERQPVQSERAGEALAKQRERDAQQPLIAQARQLAAQRLQLEAQVRAADRDVQERRERHTLALRALHQALPRGAADVDADVATLRARLADAQTALTRALAGADDVRTRREQLRQADQRLQLQRTAVADAQRAWAAQLAAETSGQVHTATLAAQAAILADLETGLGRIAARRAVVVGESDAQRRDLAAFELVHNLANERKHLAPGQPCPLCGGASHPYVDDGRFAEIDAHALERTEALRAQLAALAAELEELDGQTLDLRTARAQATEKQRQAEQGQDTARVAVAQARSELAGALELAGLPAAATLADVQAMAATLTAQQAAEAAQAQLLDTAESGLAAAQRAVHAAETALVAARGAQELLAVATQAHAARVAELADVTTQAAAVLGGRSPDAVAAALDEAVTRAVDAQRAADAAVMTAHTAWLEAQAALSQGQHQVQVLQAAHAELEAELRASLRALDLADVAALRALVLEPAVVQSLRHTKTRVTAALTAAQALVTAKAREQAAHADARPTGLDDHAEVAALADALAQDEAQLAADMTVLAQHEATLRQEDANRDRRKSLREVATAREAELQLWTRLHGLIGTNDGQAFQRFAQILNMEELAGKANHHLTQLSPRYALVTATAGGVPTLDFAVRDSFQADEVRPLTTLSGGETFLVSLALALALADYRSLRMPVETLLLDEGFGTLDPVTLKDAIRTLQALHQTSRVQVGLISHVEALQGEIPAWVVVESLGNGRSTVRMRVGD